VVAPALERVDLYPAAGRQDQRAEQLARWIAGRAARDEHAGEHRVAHRAEPERDVAGPVHRDAAHPEVLVRIDDRALLEYRRLGSWAADLVPADRGQRAAEHGVVHDERLVIAKVAIGEPEHHAIGQAVDLLAGLGLGDARD